MSANATVFDYRPKRRWSQLCKFCRECHQPNLPHRCFCERCAAPFPTVMAGIIVRGDSETKADAWATPPFKAGV